LSDLLRPQNLVLLGVILSMSGLLVSALGWVRLTRGVSAVPAAMAARQTELDHRLQEVARLQNQVAASSSELSGLRQQYEAWLNGGDSFCYASAAIIARTTAVRSIVHQGKYPLYDVELTITDASAGSAATPERVQLAYLAPQSTRIAGRWHLPPDRKEQKYIVHISARNGSLTENLEFRRTDDRWTATVRVLRDATGQLLLAKAALPQIEAQPAGIDRSQVADRLQLPGKTVEPSSAVGWTAVEMPLPAFHLEDAQGRQWSLADFAGRTVLINIWATWCQACVAEHAHLQRLYEHHTGDAGVLVVGFNIDSDPAPALDYLRKHGYTFPVLFARDLVARIFEKISIPTTWIVDAKGTVRWERSGFDARAPWETEAECVLEKTRGGANCR
jgi:thiol-disulfide isomerase/thioredoxin